jgi:hypothetical protein
MEHTAITGESRRDRFMRAAEEAMAEFERREVEFRKKDRQARANELNLPALSLKLGIENVQ